MSQSGKKSAPRGLLARFAQMNDLRKLTSQAGIIVIARVVGSLLTLVYTIMLAQLATPQDLGIAFAALSTAFLISIAMSANVESGSIRYLPLYLDAKKLEEATGFVVFGARIIAASCLLAVFVAIALYLGWEDYAAAPYAIAVLTSPIMAYTRMTSRHATALNKILHGLLPRILVRPLLFVLVIGVCAQIDYRPTASEIMGLFLTAAALSAILQWVLVRPTLAFCKGVRPRFAERKIWLLTGFMLMPMLLLQEHLRDLQIVAAGFALDPAEVAVFTIALSLVGPLAFITTAVDSAFSPRIARTVLQEQPWQRARLLSLAGVLKCGGLAVGAVVVYAIIPTVLGYLGDAYSEARMLFLILLLMPFCIAVLGPGTLIFNILGKRRDLLGVTILGVCIYVAAVFVGAGIAGVTGACAGCVLATFLFRIALTTLCYRRSGVDCSILAVRTFKLSQKAVGEG